MNADLTEAQFLDVLRKACREAGSQSAWAKQNDLSPGFVCDVLTGRRAVTDTILKAVGYEAIERRYRKKR